MPKAKKIENKRETIAATKPGKAIRSAAKLKAKKSANAAIRSFVFSPTFNVVALVCLLLAVFAGMRIFSARRNFAQVAFVERAETGAPESETSDNRIYAAPEIFRGEVYDTSIRLRETGALGMAMSLAVFAEFSERKNISANLQTVLAAVKERGLMPPEMTIQNGELQSSSSKFLVRYKSQPQLAFEILSSSNQIARRSPALMLRFPLQSLDKRTITYFQSASSSNFNVPEPFAPFEKIVAAGWTIEQWRGELMPNGEKVLRLLDEEKRLLGEMTNR